MRLVEAHNVIKIAHRDYLPWRGVNPNIQIVPTMDEADYVFYSAIGDGDAMRDDLIWLSTIKKPLVSVTLGDWDYSMALDPANRERHFSTASPVWERCVPYLYNHCQRVPVEDDEPRPILASFRGSMSTNRDREKLLTVACDDVVVESMEWWQLKIADKPPNAERHNTLLRNSKYTFCPHGFGRSSIRLTEAIMSRSIPITIDDNTRLFGQEMEWAISIRWEQLGAALDFIRIMPDEEYRDRRHEMDKFAEAYLLGDEKAGCTGTLGYTEYIRKMVEAKL